MNSLNHFVLFVHAACGCTACAGVWRIERVSPVDGAAPDVHSRWDVEMTIRRMTAKMALANDQPQMLVASSMFSGFMASV